MPPAAKRDVPSSSSPAPPTIAQQLLAAARRLEELGQTSTATPSTSPSPDKQ